MNLYFNARMFENSKPSPAMMAVKVQYGLRDDGRDRWVAQVLRDKARKWVETATGYYPSEPEIKAALQILEDGGELTYHTAMGQYSVNLEKINR